MESKFYIGQKVVAVRDHSQGSYKKGDTFYVMDIRQTCCSINIRIDMVTNRHMICTTCGGHFLNLKGYFDQNSFAPIQEISDFTYEEAVELVSEKITI